MDRAAGPDVTGDATLSFGKIRLLDVPHAANVAREIFDEDCYSFDRFPRGAVVIDVGAFYGEFSIRCALEKGCRVFAYEPCPRNREIFEKNRRLNGCEGEIAISANAIGTPGSRSFLSRSDHPAGSLFAEEGARHGLTGNVSQIACVSLADEIRAIRRLFPKTPLCVKLDCEGAEHEIFADTAWFSEVTLLVMEWHNHDGAFFRSLLKPHGFEVTLEAGGPKPRPPWDVTIGGGLLFAIRGSR